MPHLFTFSTKHFPFFFHINFAEVPWCLYIYLLIYLFICLSIYLSIYLFVFYLSIYPSMYVSIYTGFFSKVVYPNCFQVAGKCRYLRLVLVTLKVHKSARFLKIFLLKKSFEISVNNLLNLFFQMIH